MRAKSLSTKKKKRVGRGNGSGHGKTSCRGHKGQNSRTGASKSPGFEGGQNPLYRRLPKRGFSNAAFRREFTILNLSRLAELDMKEVSPEDLVKKGVFRDIRAGLKILGSGEIKTAVTVKAHSFSASAKEKIVKAGGQAILIEK